MTLFRLIAVALVMTLAGCSDNPAPPQQFDLLFDVANKTSTNFTRASIRDAASGIEYRSGNFECAAGQQDCTIHYTGAAINGATDFIFQDEQGVVVAAYQLGGPPNVFTALDVSPRTTGFFLVNQLQRRSPEWAAAPQSQREALAYNFTLNYTSPDGSADYYEEIAAQYAHQVRKEGLSVAQFIDTLSARLNNGDIAAAEEFTPLATASGVGPGGSIAVAPDDSCSSAVSSALTISGAVAFGVQNAFPIAGTVMSAAVGLFQSACDDTATKLDAIDSKLNQLQLSLDGLNDSLGDLRNFTSGAAINAGEDAFQTLSQNVERLASAYRAMKANRQVSSLKEYVQATGGTQGDALRKALDSEINGGPLGTLLRNFRPAGLSANGSVSPLGGDVLVQFERLLQDGQINTIVSAVKLQCDNPPTGDLVRLRVQCNLFLGTSMSRLVAAHQMANELAAQVYEVLDAYRESDKATVEQFSYVTSRSAADYRLALKNAFKTQQNKLVNKYKSEIIGNPVSQQTGMYDAFRGLPVSFRNSIQTARCSNDKLGTVAIVGWSKRASEEYLETECKDFATPVLSRYFLKIGGRDINAQSNICNVLGVLVPCSQIAKDYVWYNAPRTSYVENNPLALRITPSTPLVGYFAVNVPSGNEYPVAIASRPLPTSGEGFRLVSDPRLISDSGVADLNFTRVFEHVQWSRDPSGFVHVTWMRFTHTDGASVVFALAGRSLTRIINMACLTADCSIGEGLQVGRAGPEQQGLLFTRGPSNLTLGKYGAMIASPDFTEHRELLGFFVKRDGQYVPIYPK